MKNAKKGLRLLSFSILLTLFWTIISFIIIYKQIKLENPDIGNILKSILVYRILITSAISLACYVINLLGLYIAGKDNKRFRRASNLTFINIALSLANIIVSAIGFVNIKNAQTMSMTVSIINIVISLAEVLIVTNIIKGSKEIAPRTKGLANFVYINFIVNVASSIAIQALLTTFLQKIGNLIITPSATIPADLSKLGLILVILFIIFIITNICYAVFYIILIFRATRNAGKERRIR